MDNNKNVFENNTKENSVKKLNASNEAKRLEDKVKAYNNTVRNNNLIKRSNNGSNGAGIALNKSGGPTGKASSSIKYGTNGNSTNSQMTNQLASKGLSAAGVPKPLADAAVNSKLGQKVIEKTKKKNPALNILDSLMGGGQKETEEQASDGGGQSFKLSLKVIKWTLIAMGPVFSIIIFCCLFISASQIFLNTTKLGHADSLSSEDAEKNINKKSEDDLGEEVTDESVAYDVLIDNEKTLTFVNKKLEKSNLEKTASTKYLKRKYNEADLSQIEDFYPTVKDLSKNYDENMVYDFFYKMYTLYTVYRDEYDVYLDLPLLMATLNLQSDDMNVIFSSNLSPEDRKKTKRKDLSDFKYDKDWTGYITNKNASTHDMEVLAQHMVSNQVKEMCVDANGKETKSNILKDKEIGTPTLVCVEGEEYKTENLGLTKDNDRYKEFLKEFIEKKYYVDTDTPISGGDNVAPGQSTNPGNTGSGYNPSQSSGNWRNWKQCGESWSNIIVPKSSSSMCNIGCLITSISIQIARSGTTTLVSPMDPGVAVNNFSFVNGGNFVWASTTNLAPNFVFYTSISLMGMNKTSIAQKLSSYDPNRYYIVLAVSTKDRSSVHHYVALDYVDLSSSNIYIMDPSGTDPNLYNVYKLYNAYIYEKKD